MVSGWKEFAFFDSTPVRDPSPANAPLYSDPELLEIIPGSNGSAFMSTRRGVVKQFNGDMQLVAELTVCEPETNGTLDFTRVVPGTANFVVTVVSRVGHPLEISVWDFGKQTLHARTTVTNGTNTFPATAFAMSADLSVLVLGFADGAIIAVRGDLLRDKGTRQRLVHTASTGVTGLALTDSGDQVFVSSVNQVMIVSTTTSKHVEVLDKTRGADLGCTAKAANNEFLVARESELAWFNRKHRGPSIELPVAHKQIYLTHDQKYLVVVAMVAPENRSLLSTESLRLMIFDLRNHLLAYNAHLSSGIKAVFEQWDRLNVVSASSGSGANTTTATAGIMYVLKEKPLDARIALLKTRKLYQVAIKMAEEAETEHTKLMLHQDFADYLFEKNDIDASLKEYIAAIDLGQSSRAIRQFKDSQHAATLLQYLNALYARGLATPQHITLQILCYTKLGKADELAEFLRSVVAATKDFEFERAISILTEMHDPQYARLAAFVAEKWPDPDLVAQIRLRQMDDVQSTLDYIQTVSVADALRILIQNSRLLLNKMPVETTGVLITLFTGKFVTKKPQSDDDVVVVAPVSPAPVSPQAPPVLQSYQAFINFLSSASYLGSHIVSAETLETDVTQPSYLPPRPRLIFPSFIGHDNEFVIFLEACLRSAPSFHSPEKDMSDIATTLFEMYLQVGSQDRARELLDSHASLLYRVNILSVSQMHSFQLTPQQLAAIGVSYADVFRKCMENEDIDSALQIFYEHASDDPDMVPQAIRQLSSNESVLRKLRERRSQRDDAKPGDDVKTGGDAKTGDDGGADDFTRVCQRALECGAMSPVQVVSILSQSPFVTIGDVKPFIQNFLKTSADQTRRHLKLAKAYEDEIEEKRSALQKERETKLVFQYNNCDQCKQPLQLPATHFACQHSFHQQCIGPDAECPECTPDNENIELLRTQNEETAAQQDYFLGELEKRSDKMKVVLDFISRGGLSKIH